MAAGFAILSIIFGLSVTLHIRNLMLLSNIEVPGHMEWLERGRLNFWLLKKNVTRACILYHQILPVGGKVPIKIIQEPHSNETHSLPVGRTKSVTDSMNSVQNGHVHSCDTKLLRLQFKFSSQLYYTSYKYVGCDCNSKPKWD